MLTAFTYIYSLINSGTIFSSIPFSVLLVSVFLDMCLAMYCLFIYSICTTTSLNKKLDIINSLKNCKEDLDKLKGHL